MGYFIILFPMYNSDRFIKFVKILGTKRRQHDRLTMHKYRIKHLKLSFLPFLSFLSFFTLSGFTNWIENLKRSILSLNLSISISSNSLFYNSNCRNYFSEGETKPSRYGLCPFMYLFFYFKAFFWNGR
jgi:hypothetical protein